MYIPVHMMGTKRKKYKPRPLDEREVIKDIRQTVANRIATEKVRRYAADTQFKMRLSPQERQRLAKLAFAAHVGSSAYLRQVINSLYEAKFKKPEET